MQEAGQLQGLLGTAPMMTPYAHNHSQVCWQAQVSVELVPVGI